MAGGFRSPVNACISHSRVITYNEWHHTTVHSGVVYNEWHHTTVHSGVVYNEWHHTIVHSVLRNLRSFSSDFFAKAYLLGSLKQAQSEYKLAIWQIQKKSVAVRGGGGGGGVKPPQSFFLDCQFENSDWPSGDPDTPPPFWRIPGSAPGSVY